MKASACLALANMLSTAMPICLVSINLPLFSVQATSTRCPAWSDSKLSGQLRIGVKQVVGKLLQARGFGCRAVSVPGVWRVARTTIGHNITPFLKSVTRIETRGHATAES